MQPFRLEIERKKDKSDDKLPKQVDMLRKQKLYIYIKKKLCKFVSIIVQHSPAETCLSFNSCYSVSITQKRRSKVI